MALDIAFEYESVTADRLTGTLVDNTVYGTSGNPARNEVGVFVSGQKMKYNSTVDQNLTVTGNETDPSTDTAWTFNIVKDGWTRFPIAIIPDYDPDTSYDLYNAVRDGSNNVYRSLQSSNFGNSLNNVTFWEPIPDPSALALNEGESNESANINSQNYQIVPSPNTETAFANAISIASTESGDVSREPANELYALMGCLVDGMYVRSDRSQFAQAEEIARRAQTIYTENNLI